LQNKSLTRDVFVVPPIDFVGSHLGWRLKKPFYGIMSAPKSWFYRLIEVCRASGLTTATTDDGLLIMTRGEKVVGVLALQVDVAISGGNEEFHGVMAQIGKTFAVGSHETSDFRYKGLRVSTVFKEEQTVFEINVDGDDYLASFRTMDVPLGEDTDLLPPQSMTDYRSVVGTIGYSSSEFRPDLARETSSLSRQFVTPTVLAVEGYDATMWLLALWKEISGQGLDALLVSDSKILQQKAVSTALPTEKRLRIDMALLRQDLRRGEYGLVLAGSSSNLENPLTKGPRGISPTMSVMLPLLRALETNCTHFDGSYPYQNLGGCEQVLATFSRRNNAAGQLFL
jgi:hypothetical protein